MSLGSKLSEIRERGREAVRNRDGQAALNLLAADLVPLVDVAFQLNNVLRQFDRQQWARRQMLEACNTLGIRPPDTSFVENHSTQ